MAFTNKKLHYNLAMYFLIHSFYWNKLSPTISKYAQFINMVS